MRRARGRPAPRGVLPCLGLCLLWPVVLGNSTSTAVTHFSVSLCTSQDTVRVTSSPSRVSNTSPTTSEGTAGTTLLDTTPGITGDTSVPGRRSPNTITSGASTTEGPSSHRTQTTEIRRTSQSITYPAVTTSAPASSPSENTLTVASVQETSTPLEETTSSPSGSSNTLTRPSSGLSHTISPDSTPGNPGVTSHPVTTSLSAVTSGLSVTAGPSDPPTAPSPSISAQDTSVLTQSVETTSDFQTSTFTGVTTASLSTTMSGSTVTETAPPLEVTTSSPSSVSTAAPVTSEVVTRAAPTTSTPGNSRHTSPPVTGSLSPVPTGVSTTSAPNGPLTVLSPGTPAQDTSANSQHYLDQSFLTTRDSPTSAITDVTPSPPSSSAGRTTLTMTASPETPLASQAITSLPSSTRSTSPVTTERLTRVAPTGSTLGNLGLTSHPVTTSLSAVTSGLSMTAGPSDPPTALSPSTSTRDTPVLTQSVETTSDSQTSTFTGVATSLSTTMSGNTVTETAPPLEATTSSPSRVTNTPSSTSEVLGWTVSTASAPGSTGDATLPVPGGLSPITTEVSTPPAPAGPSAAQSSSPSASPSPHHPTRSMEASGVVPTAHTPTLASDTTPASSTASARTCVGSASPDMSPLAASPSFSSSPSTVALPTPPATGSFTATMPGTTRAKSFLPSTFSSSPLGVPTPESPTEVPTPTSPSALPQETSAPSQTPPHQRTGATREFEATSLVSLGTGSVSAVTLPPTAPIPSGYVSPQAGTHTLSPSGTGTAFISAPVSGGPETLSTAPTLTSTGSPMPSEVTSPSPASILPTSGQVLVTSPGTVTHETLAAMGLPALGSSNQTQANGTHLPASSVGSLSTPTSTPPRATHAASAPTPGTSPEHTRPTHSHSSLAGPAPTPSPLSTSYASIKDTRETSASRPPSPQPPTASPSPGSGGNTDMGGTVPSGHTPTVHPSVSHSAPAVVTRGPPTLPAGRPSPLPVTSPSLLSTTPTGSPEKTGTSGMSTATLVPGGPGSTVTSRTSRAPLTHPRSTPSTPKSTHAAHPPGPGQPEPGISLFDYGPSAGDQQVVSRAVDFTSRLFRIRIGFPLGSSLWDSLYFTDNGQIFLPESDYQIFPYPNPPWSGFTGRDPSATVAPFWGDADFSGNRGAIFYQEYETLYSEYSPLVQQVEAWVDRFTLSWPYKARWTLKVTWVDVPAYPSWKSSGTNTYQAILSTDGSRSYALFLYQSGRMQWDASQHQGSSVLMGFTSGDGYFENSPLMLRPVWEKYRPDQFLNPRLGVRGLQIYQLHWQERTNFRLLCLQRLYGQPQWPSWSGGHISCPCSWQQGRWDLRFQPMRTGGWGLQGSRQLCSFSSWRGGVCCSYGPWGEFREGWSGQSLGHLDWDQETRNWCCRWNDRPSFCALYHQRRPCIGCAAYRPPRPAWMFGDPHITTLDGASYTFNGLGDFLLVHAWDTNSSFLLQGRTVQTGSAQATNFAAFAAQYQASSLGTVTVKFFLEPNDTICVQYNDQNVTFETDGEEGMELFNASGVLLTRNGSQVSASFDGTVTISVTAVSSILHAASSLPEEYWGHTKGLLGLWNNDPEDDFRMPNGSSLPPDSSEETLFHYGMTWRINGTGLLGQRTDPLPLNFTPVFAPQLVGNASLTSGCRGDKWCIYDSLATGSAGVGLSTSSLLRTFQQANATLYEFPPSINGCLVLQAYKAQTKRFQCTSDAENVTFVLGENDTAFRLFENGTLLWTPSLLKPLKPFTLRILAREAKANLTSSLLPRTVACFCSMEGQCRYNQTRRVGNSSLEEASCECDGDTFGRHCEHPRNLCVEPCFPGVQCHSLGGCEACPANMTGDGRHCAALVDSWPCQNRSCPVDHCYNGGHCYVSQKRDCQPTCTCPPAFIDSRCFLAGNSFVPTVHREIPRRSIQLLLSEDENATMADINASVAYRLGTLDVRAFLRNSQVNQIRLPALASGSTVQRWRVVSEFQYRPRGPVIHFLNSQLLDAVVEALLPRRRGRKQERRTEPRSDVTFFPISREDVLDGNSLNVSTLETYLTCDGYTGYRKVYSPQDGFTCVSPCSDGYCQHGGQCQHLPDGPHCSCVPLSIYVPWGERCEHLSMKLGAFFGILFGALGALLLLGVAAFLVLRFWGRSSYPMTLGN